MRIEETDKVRLSKADDRDLLILKLRFTQAWDKNVKNRSPVVVSDLTRSQFLKKYRLLLSEMGTRKLKHSTSPIDKAAFKKAMVIKRFGIDVADFEDVVIMPNYIVVDADHIDLEEIETVVKGLQLDLSKTLKREEELEKSYIPLYDLVLRAKQETTRVEIQKPYPNEHSARLQSPDMAHVRVRRSHGGKVQGVTVPGSVDVVWFIAVKEGKEVPIPQALRFPTKNWTVAKAKKWLADNDITTKKFEPATKVTKAIWSRKYIDALPDSAFLYIEEGDNKKTGLAGKGAGKEARRRRRQYPCKDASGNIDMPHLKKAITDISQSKLSKDVRDELLAKAKKILEDAKEGKKFEKYITVFPIDKAGDEHIVCGIVYEPNVVDSQDDKASEKEIRKAAYQFMEEVQVFKVNHEGKKVKVKVLENYIAPADFTLAGQSIKKGTWLLTTRVLDKKLWEAVKSGDVTGYSMAGYAKVAPT